MSKLIKGTSSPEGNVKGSMGTIYVNTQSRSAYIKVKGDSETSNGWYSIDIKSYTTRDSSPEGFIPGTQFSVCFVDIEGGTSDLYMQTLNQMPLPLTGWLSLNAGTFYKGAVDPTLEHEGEKGSIYLNETNVTVFIRVDTEWLQIPLLVIDTTDVITKLSQLLSNTTTITNQYFNMFFNPEPMDIKLAQYNSRGALTEYTIPNRAKDTIAIVGEGSPEGLVTAVCGKLYLDIIDKIPYIKTTEEDTNIGWSSLRRPSVIAPLLYNTFNNTMSINMDTFPVENSNAMVNSGTVYSELAKIRNGSVGELFSAAEPVELDNVTTKRYLDTALANFIQYDASTKTLYINTALQSSKSEGITIGATGTLFTPVYGTAYSTKFTFNNPYMEPSGKIVSLHSEIPCRINIVPEPYTDSLTGDFITPDDLTILLDYNNKTVRCFSNDMKGGIRTIIVTESSSYEGPDVNTIRNLYKQLTMITTDKPSEA